MAIDMNPLLLAYLMAGDWDGIINNPQLVKDGLRSISTLLKKIPLPMIDEGEEKFKSVLEANTINDFINNLPENTMLRKSGIQFKPDTMVFIIVRPEYDNLLWFYEVEADDNWQFDLSNAALELKISQLFLLLMDLLDNDGLVTLVIDKVKQARQQFLQQKQPKLLGNGGTDQ